ncbi:protein yellow-like [Lutzomyia longipalpis]|uniref:protein yellow-like n=1 Tax=Lutzomyia longipalpis TaxID=7200 RepID=UPI0024838F10|nr:protein yellow-like [Lutzomyia longipalpis]
MKWFTNLALLCGVAVLVQGYTPFSNRRPVTSNNSNYYYDDNRPVDLGTRIDPTPGQRKGYYGGDYVSSTSPFEIVYEWKIFDYEYPSTTERRAAIASGEYIQENTMPLGIDAYKNRFFISLPRWKTGTPATLVSVDLPSRDKSPLLRPYPNWGFHTTPTNPDCTKFMSVFRIHIDDCGRLWAIDAGMVNTTSTPNLVCPPKIVVFDLATDRHILTFPIPDGQIKEDSLYTSILVDIRDGKCDDAHAYVTDVWRNGLWVFSLGKRRSWRTSNYFMLPNPHACEYSFHNQLTYQWTDGIFGTALGLDDVRGDRLMYFHPMSSFGEFSVPTSILQNETIWTEGINVNTQFKQVGDRGVNSQSSTSGIDRDGVLFYTLVNQDAIGCWDTNKPLVPNNIHHVDQNRVFFSFPNDIKVDKATDQGVWVLANNLPLYLYTGLDYSQVNVRILRAGTKNAVRDTVCDPRNRGNMVWG